MLSTNFISQLLEYRQAIEFLSKRCLIPNYQSDRAYTYSEIFNAVYTPIDIELTNSPDTYNTQIALSYKNYFYAFILCLQYAVNPPIKIENFDTDAFGTKAPYSTIQNRILFQTSQLSIYILPSWESTHKPPEKSSTEEPSTEEPSTEEPSTKKPSTEKPKISNPPKVKYKRYLRTYYFDKLYNVSNALRCYIKHCPYNAVYPKLRYRNLNHPKNSNSLLHIFIPQIVTVLNVLPWNELLEVRLKQLYNVKDYSPNFNARKIKRFYSGFYKTLTGASVENVSLIQTVFDYFVTEWLLNGSFIIYCIDAFSSSKSIRLNKEVPDIAITLFHELNHLDNFFLRKILVDFFIDSYYEEYSYKGKQYQPGKQDPKTWKRTLSHEIIPNFITHTQELLSSFCSLLVSANPIKSSALSVNELKTLCDYFALSSVVSPQLHRTEFSKQLTEDLCENFFYNLTNTHTMPKIPK